MPDLQKSPNWDKYCEIRGPINEGFPFREGWPKCAPCDGKVFEIIIRNGERHKARVNFDTQYRAEGLKWRTIKGETYDKFLVVAWREIEQGE